MANGIGTQMLGELIGTFLLIVLGCGIGAGASLKKTKSEQNSWLTIAIGWGLAVAISVYVSSPLGPGHLNPAVTLAMAVTGNLPWSSVLPYIVAQFAGAFLGAMALWLKYYPHWAETKDSGTILGVFSTAPAIRHTPANIFSEGMGTAVLVFAVLSFSKIEFVAGLQPIVVGMLITVIILAMGGTTGAALNPARDLAPRVAHAILPIPNKGGSDWGYAWIPVVAPILGGLAAAWLYQQLP